eukprot:gb/GEZN01001672.1/.p1 GENE.gb/GEZN01001672.1/~~gb/GEZN01001672.1/.p1  ORF type:complete len:883 (-),score=119.02 gb/GEZN01001672.1/:239-2863(-)
MEAEKQEAEDAMQDYQAASLEDDEDDEDEVSESDEDLDEEEEPKLKYQRLVADVTEILKTDCACCLVAHEKFLVLGTQAGIVYVLDLNANKVMEIKVHSDRINDMALDALGDYVATCSDDGTVVITNVFSREKRVQDYRKSVKAIAIPNSYKQKSNEIFCCGGMGKMLIMNQKSFWGFSYKDTVIHAGEGRIFAIAWRGNLIAWANEKGTKLWDHVTEERISYVARSKAAPPPEQYRCNLRWADDYTLVIGWGNSVSIGKIVRKGSGSGVSTRNLQIVAMFTTDFFICGIAPFGEYLVILAYSPEEEDGHSDPSRQERKALPELKVLTWKNEEISSDALPILGCENYEATDYRVDYLPGNSGAESLFYIVSPKDIVVARPRDLDDHITWLLEHEMYAEALQAAQNSPIGTLKKHKILGIGEQYLHHLMRRGDYKKAASMLPQLIEDNETLWENWVMAFLREKHLSDLGPYVPTSSPQLKQSIYEVILHNFLLNDHDEFLRTINSWPHRIYSIEAVIHAVNQQLKQHESKQLLTALSDLYVMNSQFSKALHVYLKLGRKDVFQLIKKLDLYHAVRDKVLELMVFDTEKAVELLVENLENMSVAGVMAQLSNRPDLEHAYLSAVFKKDPQAASKFHPQQVCLYADYNPEKLLPFLRSSNAYVLEEAFLICSKRNLFPEMVFLLQRMGNTNRALEIIIGDLKDVPQAIAFAEEQKDPMLWEELTKAALATPALLSDLLEHVGAHYEGLPTLVSRIPNEARVKELKRKFQNIFSDWELQLHVRAGCNKILQTDVVDLQDRLDILQRSALQVDSETRCALCEQSVMNGRPEDLQAFFCSHCYHTKCLVKHRRNACTVPICVLCSPSSQALSDSDSQYRH